MSSDGGRRDKYAAVKKRVFDIIQISNTSDFPSRVFDICLVVVITANILVMFLETFSAMAPYKGILDAVETVTLSLFMLEYILRIWTAEFLFPGKSRLEARLRFMISFDGVVELLTILPFFFLSGAVTLRLMRVVRIFHLFRINANYDSFNVITSVLKEKRNQILSSLFIILILMLASSLCMYSAEHAAQPDKFKNAFSGMWWSVSALLTVGYGDIYPVTVMGKALAIVISFLGVGAVAIPTGIISAGFVEHYNKAQAGENALDGHIFTVVVDIDSSWLGLGAGDVEALHKTMILLVRRGDVTFKPGVKYRVELGDMLGVYRLPREE